MSKLLPQKQAIKKIQAIGTEFFIVQNPDFVFPEYELYPLPPKPVYPLQNISGVVMDMDGTTTTTEVLCIHSLEYMVRLITGNIRNNGWAGLHEQRDYPHIIGNSTTRHVEYLMQTFMNEIIPEQFYTHFLHAASWTVLLGKDANRKKEVITNLRQNDFGIFADKLVKRTIKHSNRLSDFESLVHEQQKLKMPEFNTLVRLAIDIYYQRYHYILQQIDKGNSAFLQKLLPPDKHKRFIEPMPGIGEFLALAKGLLGNSAPQLAKQLIIQFNEKSNHTQTPPKTNEVKSTLKQLSKRFAKTPLKIGVVTSSIGYEANIVLREVFKNLVHDVQQWPVSDTIIQSLSKAFSEPADFYDAIVTASDSHEIRLKPHRDLYSIALYNMGIRKSEFGSVIGFEDSESGNIAIKVAGIGTAIAVPFAQTANHNLEAADFIMPGGIPEAILQHKLFLEI